MEVLVIPKNIIGDGPKKKIYNEWDSQIQNYENVHTDFSE